MRHRLSEPSEMRTPGIVIVAFFTMTLSVFGPSTVYLTNALEFSNTYGDLLFTGIGLAVLFSLFLFLFLSALGALGSAFLEKGLSLLFGGAFLIWLQGNFLLWPYGPMDGRDIPWPSMNRYGYIDGGIWIGVLIAAFVLSPLVLRIAKRAGIFLILVQSVYCLVLFFGQQEVPSFKKYLVDVRDRFVFSERKNVIILVLDSFQTDVFNEIINDSPGIAKAFDGFTYFRNSLGGYPFSELSIALMLTGKYYDNSLPFERWKKDAYTANSIPYVLKAENWQVDLFPKVSYSLYYSNEIASNFVRGLPFKERQLAMAYVHDLSLFRCLPHFLKRKINNHQEWVFKRLFVSRPKKGPPIITKDAIPRTVNSEKRKYSRKRELFSRKAFLLSQDVRFTNTMLSDSRLDGTKSIFKFYHLGIPHIPLILNEKLEYEKMDLNRQNYKRYATAGLKLATMFLDNLQRLGIYDNSLIFLVGDHGAGYQDQDFVLQSGMPLERGTGIVTQSSRVTALPLILVKPLASRGALRISDAPVSLSDIPATVFSSLGVSIKNSGTSMFAIDETKTRERRFLMYSGRDYYSYYAEMFEYMISGYSWQDGAWRRSGRVFTKNGIVELRRNLYRYGSPLALSLMGNGLPYLDYGWCLPDKEFTWTEGQRSLLVLPVENPPSDLTLRVSLHPSGNLFKAGNQDVFVSVNGSQLGKWVIKTHGESEYTMMIPKDLVNHTLKIQFEIPGALSVSEPVYGEDVRKLGIGIHKFRVELRRTDVN